MLLNLHQLTIGYTDHKPHKIVHENIDLQLDYGELICLLGTNGAGKSTLLKTIGGFQSPLSGSIFLNGKELKSYSRKALAQKLGVVLTDNIRVGNLTVEELVSFGRYNFTGFFGRLSDNDRAMVNHALQSVGIEEFASRSILELSDGERQKVMIAKAIAQETELILLDEPTAFLDLPSRVEIMQLLRRLATEQQKTILLSTHDLDLAIQLADKIWLMEKREPIVSGVPEDLALNGAFNRFFDKEQLKFDGISGTFKIVYSNSKQINLFGDGPTRFWVEKAVARVGFEVVSSPTSHSVTFTNDGYQVTTSKGIYKAKDIATMLSLIAR